MNFAGTLANPWRRARNGLLSMMVGALLMVATPSHAQDGSFLSSGLELHYRSIGTGPPVVILSGGPGFEVDYMLPVADVFPTYRRILLEQRGTGRTREAKLTAGDMTLEVVVQDLEALRVHLKQDRLFLAGHSWGGMLALAYAAAHPDRIDRHSLLKSSTLIYLDKCGHFPWLEQPEAFRQAIGSFMAGSGPKKNLRQGAGRCASDGSAWPAPMMMASRSVTAAP